MGYILGCMVVLGIIAFALYWLGWLRTVSKATLMLIITAVIGGMFASSIEVSFETLESLFALQFLCAVAGACVCIKRHDTFIGIVFFILCMSV